MTPLVHTVEVHIERGDTEVTLRCRVEQVGSGREMELELDWLDGEPLDAELEGAEDRARDKFMDWVWEQPSPQDYRDEAADRAYDERRDERHLEGK